MSAVAWTLNGNSFASLGLANLQRTLVSQGVDTVSFDAPGTSFTAPALLSYREVATIQRNGVNWFKGIVRTVPRMGEPADERISYELAGPWWYLDHIVYQQNWNLWNEDKEDGAGLELQYKSHVILGQNESAEAITVGAQITDALNFAVLKGAPITVGTIEPTIILPFDEQVDITVSEVITRLMRFLPDYMVYFNYTSEVPTINIVSRASAAAKTYAVTSGAPAHQIRITAREDLKIPGVICRFEQTHTVDDETYESQTIQEAGNTSDYETLVTTVRLGGSRISYLTQKIVVEEIPDPLEDLAWIQGHDPYLKLFTDPNDVQITSVTRNGALALPNILTEGQLHEWIDKQHETEEFTVEALVDIRKPNGEVIRQDEIKRTFKVTTTDATSRTYRQLDSIEGGEVIPEGMATALFASWGQLQYDGSFVLLEEECTSQVRPGNVLCLTGGLSLWASMRATIQSVQEVVDTGMTTITFGPAKRIGIDDLVTLLRGFRNRKVSMGEHKSRSTGKADDAGNVAALGGAPGVQDAVAGGPGKINKVITQQTNTPAGSEYTQEIRVDPSDIVKTDADVSIKARELYTFGATLTALQKRQIMASEGYDTAVPLTEITVVTDVRYDTTTKQIQKKFRTAVVINPGILSDWTMITGGQAVECTDP